MPKTSAQPEYCSDSSRILAGIALREALAHGATPSPWVWNLADDGLRCVGAQGAVVASAPRSGTGWDNANHIAANDPSHVLAVLAAARQELAEALAQQERQVAAARALGRVSVDDAKQSARTIARLLMLYGQPG